MVITMNCENKTVSVSTPSRVCLFGEHQDYLGLEVIALAINLRFKAKASFRDDMLMKIRIRDEKLGILGEAETDSYDEILIDLSQELTYENSRDYFKSAINVLKRSGLKIECGADIVMDSEIPIGKGMCSSTTMTVVFTKALMELYDHPEKDDPFMVAHYAWQAEVEEFNEPGGKMDHYASALGGLVHLDFQNGTEAEKLDVELPGCLILFDTLTRKDTIGVLKRAKNPVLAGLDELKKDGITSIRDFYGHPEKLALLEHLDEEKSRKVKAQIRDFEILQEALAMFKSGKIDDVHIGELIREHHAMLRDGLGISTDKIEEILDCAYAHGALGGKLNGTGGGGCLWVYAREEDADEIVKAVAKLGYPGKILKQDRGVSKDA